MPTKISWVMRRLRVALALAVTGIGLDPGAALARDIGSVENVRAVQETRIVDGRAREVLYLMPGTAPAGTARVPAVILLEYLQGSPVDMADLVAASELVRDQGIYVIMPGSFNGRWNYGASSFAVAINDVGFIDNVLDDALARLPIDPARIYIGGYSNGAQMAQRYICERSSRIAAGAVIAGSLHQDDRRRCAPPLATPMIILHGTADEQINVDGNLLFTSSVATAEHWAGLAGCVGQPVALAPIDTVDDGTSIRVNRYGGCRNGARVDHYLIEGAGHTWPGTLSFSAALGRSTQDVSATPLIWQFFSSFSRP